MLSQLIQWGGITLEVLLLIRGLQGKFAFRYPLFYSYVSFVVFQDLLSLVVHRWYRPYYPAVYWSTEFVALLFGCGVVFEIYRLGLSAFPGTARMARNALALVFAAAITMGIAQAWTDPRWWMQAATTDIEGALRAVEALAIVVLAALFLFYSIPVGKNLRGILLGYGLFVGASVLSLEFVSTAGSAFHRFLGAATPGLYFLCLCLWAAHLWSYVPNPMPAATVRLEQEYLRAAAATHRRLQDARGYLAKAVRP